MKIFIALLFSCVSLLAQTNGIGNVQSYPSVSCYNGYEKMTGETFTNRNLIVGTNIFYGVIPMTWHSEIQTDAWVTLSITTPVLSPDEQFDAVYRASIQHQVANVNSNVVGTVTWNGESKTLVLESHPIGHVFRDYDPVIDLFQGTKVSPISPQ